MADTCVNCNAVLSPSSTSCPSCGSPRRSPSTGGGGGGGFCGSCGTTLASKYSPCPKCGHVKTTFAPPPQSGGFCGGCGGPLASKFAPCPKCGHVKTTFNPAVPPQGGLYKNEGTGLILSIVLGLLGLVGVGQIYAGHVGKGIGMLIGGIICIALAFFTFGITAVIYIILLIWGAIDTKKLCREYNDFLSTNGRPPW